MDVGNRFIGRLGLWREKKFCKFMVFSLLFYRFCIFLRIYLND